jgi:GT2 family glycosyltransferase
MNHKIGIISVGLNCLEYSKKTLDSINTKYPYQIIFINNGSSDGTREWLESREDIISYQNPANSGLAACWNLGIQRAIDEGCDLFFVVNNDIVMAKNTIDNLVRKMETGKYVMCTGVNDHSMTEDEMKNFEKEYDENETDREHPDFSCFMINENTIHKIGWFDEHFVIAYFEDSDFHSRIALAGKIAISTVSATYFHHASKTIQENPKMSELIHNAFRLNKQYFIDKWGTENVGDVPAMLQVYYKTPFNDPSRTIKDISGNFSLEGLSQ